MPEVIRTTSVECGDCGVHFDPEPAAEVLSGQRVPCPQCGAEHARVVVSVTDSPGAEPPPG